MELANYTDVIKQLSQLYNDPDFLSLFEQLTDGENKSTRFLIKMEVNRISAPTRRIIDFRHHNDKGIMHYEYAGILHHLNIAEIKYFDQQIAQNQGHYTLGVYENVVAYHNANRSLPEYDRQTNNANPLAEFNADPLLFGSYFVRSEERMHYSTAIRMRIDNIMLEATTSDISTSGLRVKVEKHQSFMVGSLVGVNFSGFRLEFANHMLKDFFGYQLMGIDEEEKFNFLRLMRTGVHNELDVFISKLITGNKHKYKVKVRYLEDNVTVKGYEQFFLPRMAGLPLYISAQGKPHLSHLLVNENNREVYDYWRNEELVSQLEGFFQTPWIQAQLQSGQPIETSIYSFYYTQNARLYFYAASAEQLQQSGLKGLFLPFAAQRPNFRVFKLSLQPAQIDSQRHFIDVDDKKQWISLQAKQSLNAIRWVGLLHDISNEHILDDYKAYEQEGCNFNLLHQFRLPSTEICAQLTQLKFVQLRKEARFSYKTAIIASAAEQTLMGWSNDFSTEGLQIELEAPMDIEVGNRIFLELPHLQKLSKSVTLTNLAYVVVGCNKAKTVLHLQIYGNKDQHVSRQFFSLLIGSNKDKLRMIPEPKQAPELASVLRNMYSSNLLTTPLYIHKVNKRYQVDRIAVSEHDNRLMRLFRQFANADSTCTSSYNLYPILHNQAVTQSLETALTQLQSSYRPWQQVLYIAVSGEVVSQFEIEFRDEVERKLFITKALQRGDFYAVQVMLSRTGRPDMEYIAKELHYVNHYAAHRAQKLETALWSVQGVIDLVDVTDELLFRLGLRTIR